MTDEEKILECIKNWNGGMGIRINDIWGETGILISTVMEIIDKLIKDEKIYVYPNGGFKYYRIA